MLEHFSLRIKFTKVKFWLWIIRLQETGGSSRGSTAEKTPTPEATTGSRVSTLATSTLPTRTSGSTTWPTVEAETTSAAPTSSSPWPTSLFRFPELFNMIIQTLLSPPRCLSRLKKFIESNPSFWYFSYWNSSMTFLSS